jgi:endogenous inhibitor of DNA gyrase (YacG/DUF329 family)
MPRRGKEVGVRLIIQKSCSKCGTKTDWDNQSKELPLCERCWDAAADGKVVVVSGGARSASRAEAGINTGEDFARVMSDLMADVLAGRVTPDVAKAACDAGRNLLKVVEMQYRLTNGRTFEEKEGAVLRLMSPVAPSTAPSGASAPAESVAGKDGAIEES